MNRRQLARLMRSELLGSRLTVVKLPTDRGWIRVVEEENGPWYRHLCASHTRERPRWRKLKTVITRRETLAALNRIINWREDSLYAQRIIAVMSWYEKKRDEQHEREREMFERSRA